MHRWMSILLFALCATGAKAYHSGINETETADSNASCNAAFHAGCATAVDDHEEQTHTASSSGFAAPAGPLGGSALEIALIALLLGGMVGGRVVDLKSAATSPDHAAKP